MKKVICYLLVAVLLVAALFTLTACRNKEGEPKEEAYTKEVDTYTLEGVYGGTVEFSIAKELGYTGEADGNRIKLDGPEGSHLSFYFMYDYKNSSSVWKKEDAYSKNSFFGYEETTLGGYQAYKIYDDDEETDNPFGVEGALILSEPDANNKVYGLTYEITRSGLDQEKVFNPKTMFENPDFQHVFETIKLTPAAAEATETPEE